MRVASFVNYLEFEFEGTINKNAVVLGDVDNDGLNELIIGNENGVVAVFKDENPRPVCVGTDLGMISALAVGDVFNSGQNALVVVTGCGQCHIYDFEDIPLATSGEHLMIQPIHTQRIPSNIKVVLVGDVNGDGFSEMVVGLTDRVVRTYRWVSGGHQVGGRPLGKLVGLNKWELGEQIGGITFNRCRDGSPSLLVAQPGGTYFTLKVQPAGQDSQLDPFDESSSELLTKMSLDYEPLASARLRNPNIHTEICGNIRLSLAESGCTNSEAEAVETLRSQPVRLGSNETEEYIQYQTSTLATTDITHHNTKTLTSHTATHHSIPQTSQLKGNGSKESGLISKDGLLKNEIILYDIRSELAEDVSNSKIQQEKVREKEEGGENEEKLKLTESRKVSEVKDREEELNHGYALATLDGTLMLVQEGKIQWNLQVDHQLFAVCGLDVTGDGKEEVVACAWDGNTYIVCEAKDCVRFTFHHPVSAFTAGLYGLKGRQMTCLVYVSFGPRVWVYYDLDVAPVVTRTLTQVLEQEPSYPQLLNKLGLAQADPTTLRHLHRYLLYGYVD